MSRFDHVGLNVADLEAMTAWYCAAFELEVEFEFALDHVELLRRDAALARRAGGSSCCTAPARSPACRPPTPSRRR